MLYFQDILCHEVTSSRCGNNLAQQTSCSLCNSKTTELQHQWISNLSELSREATSSKANPSPPQAPCFSPQAPLPLTIQFPSSSVYPTLNQATGIVHPVTKNTPLNKGCDNCPSMATITSEIKSSSNLAPAPICTVSKDSDIIPQKQTATSMIGIESQQPSILGATCPSALVNKAVAPNSAPSLSPNHLYALNSLQQPPKYTFQLPTEYTEQTTLSTLSNYAQKPNSSPTAATCSVFTEPPNLNSCSPRYYFKNFPSTVVPNVEPMNIAPASSQPRSNLPSESKKPQVVFLVANNSPTESTIVQNENKLDINVEDGSSAIVLSEENYGNIEFVNRVNTDSVNAINEPAISIDAESGAVNSQWPINLVISFPSMNVPAPSETFLPTPSSSSILSLPSVPAPVGNQFVQTPTTPIIIKSSKSKLKSLLPIIMMSLLKDRVPCGEGCSCNCGSRCIPIPFPVPIPL